MAKQGPAGFSRYEGLRTRAHWKAEDAARVLADWSSSGESMTAFARRWGLGLHRLQWWRERLNRGSETETQSLRLVPAVVRRAPLVSFGAVTPGAPVCIALDGVRMRVEVSDPNGTDPRWLAALVSELRGMRA